MQQGVEYRVTVSVLLRFLFFLFCGASFLGFSDCVDKEYTYSRVRVDVVGSNFFRSFNEQIGGDCSDSQEFLDRAIALWLEKKNAFFGADALTNACPDAKLEALTLARVFSFGWQNEGNQAKKPSFLGKFSSPDFFGNFGLGAFYILDLLSPMLGSSKLKIEESRVYLKEKFSSDRFLSILEGFLLLNLFLSDGKSVYLPAKSADLFSLSSWRRDLEKGKSSSFQKHLLSPPLKSDVLSQSVILSQSVKSDVLSQSVILSQSVKSDVLSQGVFDLCIDQKSLGYKFFVEKYQDLSVSSFVKRCSVIFVCLFFSQYYSGYVWSFFGLPVKELPFPFSMPGMPKEGLLYDFICEFTGP